MRAFSAACLAIILIVVGGYFVLSAVQQPSGVAFASDAARIDTSWAWRSPLSFTSVADPGKKTVQEEACQKHSPWQWIFIDFGRRDGESGACWASQ